MDKNRIVEKLFCRQGEMMVTWTGMVEAEKEKNRRFKKYLREKNRKQ